MLVSLKVRRSCEGGAVVCIGGGPSLTQDDINYVKGKAKVIAINDAYRLAPWADILYACDLKWWDWHNGCPDFKGDKWTMDVKASLKYCLRYIEGVAGRGLSDDQAKIHQGQNSGFQAINIAHLMGASKIILLGYDMQFTNNQAHWFGDHPDKVRSNYVPWLKHFEAVADQGKANIINSTRDTALECFPKIPLREIL